MEKFLHENTEAPKDARLEKLFIAARNARETNDHRTALKHYEEISSIEPNNWEALFYLVILKTNDITNGEISNAAISVSNCIAKVFDLINSTVKDEQEKKSAVQEVVEQCYKTATALASGSYNFYNSITRNDITFSIMVAAVNMDAKRKAKYESAQRLVNIGNIMCICGNAIEKIFGLADEYYHKYASLCWEKMIEMHFEHIEKINVAVFNEESIQIFAQKIKKFNPSFVIPDIKATEKRNYTIVGILLVLAAFAVGIIIALPLLI